LPDIGFYLCKSGKPGLQRPPQRPPPLFLMELDALSGRFRSVCKASQGLLRQIKAWLSPLGHFPNTTLNTPRM